MITQNVRGYRDRPNKRVSVKRAIDTCSNGTRTIFLGTNHSISSEVDPNIRLHVVPVTSIASEGDLKAKLREADLVPR